MQNTIKHTGIIACEFCGKTLQARTFDLMGSELFCGWEDCDCEESALNRARIEQEIREREAQEAERKRAEQVANTGIPPKYQNAEHKWAEHLANLVEEGKGFYFHGRNGTGKTTLVCAAGLILEERGYKVRFYVSTKLLDKLRDFDDEARQLADELASCDVLIIDDLGKEGAATPRAAEKLFDIFNDRDNESTKFKKKPLLVTSNFKRSAVASAVSHGGAGVAIASRLAGMTESVPIDGDDWRLKDD